jgi:hypothetical protein
MTPVSSPPSLETEEAASPFFQLLQQMPLECHEKERFMESDILGVHIYPEKGFLVIRLKLPTPITAVCCAKVAGYLKESLPGVNRVILDAHYAPSVINPADYLLNHEKDFIFCLMEEGDIDPGWFSHYKLEVNGPDLILHLPHEHARQHLESRQCKKIIRDVLKARCGAEVNVKFDINSAIIPPAPEVEKTEEVAAPKAAPGIVMFG